ncbi:hypothetical protein [Halorubrum sp. AS12]|uniref:hypothetical protein n=1 Tax=Halorubrum sp. AS12 TaxID=3409687 RepID=UPI003DA72AE5
MRESAVRKSAVRESDPSSSETDFSAASPAAAAVGASVYLVEPLVDAAGLLRWSIRLDGYSP